MITRYLGLTDYQVTWSDMRAFTDQRSSADEDELWVCEHLPVYTLGQAGRREHIHNPVDIPVVQSDRGGQVTFHGPGQLVFYTMIDLRRAGFGVRDMVVRLENSVINLLQDHGIAAKSRRDAPGVYVDDAKVAALGLRVRRGATYHGLAFNVDMDLSPFEGIDPCGYRNLAVTSARKLGVRDSQDEVMEQLLLHLYAQLQHTQLHVVSPL